MGEDYWHTLVHKERKLKLSLAAFTPKWNLQQETNLQSIP